MSTNNKKRKSETSIQTEQKESKKIDCSPTPTPTPTKPSEIDESFTRKVIEHLDPCNRHRNPGLQTLHYLKETNDWPRKIDFNLWHQYFLVAGTTQHERNSTFLFALRYAEFTGQRIVVRRLIEARIDDFDMTVLYQLGICSSKPGADVVIDYYRFHTEKEKTSWTSWYYHTYLVFVKLQRITRLASVVAGIATQYAIGYNPLEEIALPATKEDRIVLDT